MSTTVELHRVKAELAALRESIAAEIDALIDEAAAICPPDYYDKADKAWRVAHVRRRVADDLRNLLGDPA